MPLQTKPFDQLVTDQAVTAQASAAGRALDFTRGSVLRALAEGFAAIGLWLQGLVLRVLAVTRASTSTGGDLDTWMADYGLTRVAATTAAGFVTFARYTPTTTALIPVGAQVKTFDGAWTYTVTDGGLAIDPVLGGYQLPAGQASITLPVKATVSGAGGNADPGTVSLLASAVAGVDTVTNSAAIAGGFEAESDASLQARFVAYIASLPRATRGAIEFAIGQVQPGLTHSVIEGQRPDGTAAPAVFTIVLDDGTGTPSADLIARVSAAVSEYRPLGVEYAVVAPVAKLITVSMQIEVSDPTAQTTAAAAVRAALLAYINALPLGAGLSYYRLSQIAFDASPLVTNVITYDINGQRQDIPPSLRQAVRTTLVTVV